MSGGQHPLIGNKGPCTVVISAHQKHLPGPSTWSRILTANYPGVSRRLATTWGEEGEVKLNVMWQNQRELHYCVVSAGLTVLPWFVPSGFVCLFLRLIIFPRYAFVASKLIQFCLVRLFVYQSCWSVLVFVLSSVLIIISLTSAVAQFLGYIPEMMWCNKVCGSPVRNADLGIIKFNRLTVFENFILLWCNQASNLNGPTA